MNDEICVTKWLPDDGKVVLCFGHKTFCCSCDMEAADWHEVIFRFVISSYKMKEKIPEDPEESILELCEGMEKWEIPGDELKCRVIGVTKWKNIPKPPKSVK